MASVKEAAEELLEMEALCLNLRSRRQECIDTIRSIKDIDETTYFLANSETKYLRLFDAQWEVYNYINTLHALWRFAVQCEPFIDGDEYSLKNTAPQLLALRNCMQHAGPVGVNYIPQDNELAVSVMRLKQKGDWGGTHAPFESYFPNAETGDLLLIRDSIEKSDVFYTTIFHELESEHRKEHSKEALTEAAQKRSLYK